MIHVFVMCCGLVNFTMSFIKIHLLFAAIGQLIVLIGFLISAYVLICPCCVYCGCVCSDGAVKGKLCIHIKPLIPCVAFM